MTIVTEKRGSTFKVTLSDSTTLTLQSGESVTIKDELISESLIKAEHMGIVSLKEKPRKETVNKKMEVQINNE